VTLSTNYVSLFLSVITKTHLGTQFGAVLSTSQAAKYRVVAGLEKFEDGFGPLLLIRSNFDILLTLFYDGFYVNMF